MYYNPFIDNRTHLTLHNDLQVEFMYAVYVHDVPFLVVCGTRKGRSKINEHYMYFGPYIGID